MSIQFFARAIPDPQPDQVRLIVPESLTVPDMVFHAYGLGLEAPNGYFGSNWDAFYDCLMDLQWIEQNRIEIVHLTLPKLSSADLKTYLQILSDACSAWAHVKTKKIAEQFDSFVPHSLNLLFSSDDEAHVSSIISRRL